MGFCSYLLGYSEFSVIPDRYIARMQNNGGLRSLESVRNAKVFFTVKIGAIRFVGVNVCDGTTGIERAAAN